MRNSPERKKIEKLLIANRGEIACRIIHTAKKLNIETAVICSDIDSNSLAASLADKVLVVGPAAASESYLNQKAVLEAAKNWGADAIHPGYGFLSENSSFADLVEQSGIVFIGPSASAMVSMASKSEAKRLMEKAGVPLLKGYHGVDQSDEVLRQEAEDIGYPVMLKAAAGGGGKGMRVVENAASFQEVLESARRESLKAFDDQVMLVEKYLPAPRHVEVQIFFDWAGNGVYLFDRDCSVQRRHQKVVEEAPAPGLTEEIQRRMGEAAVAAGQAIGYVGAGTVEFLLNTDGSFYFMEMNTRLQVEHPVTEMITGQDLVEWQIRIAEGAPLPLSQKELEKNGHSLEVRLYAEDPARDFLPATGVISHLTWPQSRPWLRIETGISEGDEVSSWYDPMIAKLVVWGHNRKEACNRLIEVLEQTRISGLETNRDFLIRILAQSEFQNEQLDTGFIERHNSELFAQNKRERACALAAVTLCQSLKPKTQAEDSIWNQSNGWRSNGVRQWYQTWQWDDEHCEVNVIQNGDGWTVTINEQQYSMTDIAVHGSMVTFDGKNFFVSPEDQKVTVTGPRLTQSLSRPDYSTTEDDGHDLTAPMNGRVVAVLVNSGQTVTNGDPLLVLEAMKMEQTIRAPHDGTIDQILHPEGNLVEEGVTLLTFQDELEATA
ncbi:ATP-grasp domain-containing protein [Sansalvadorimonas sp. 2012CJ34-2]|uniref:ATP-grasp domain-containing protein n=1 Tax=Parendozoicomonas callyspongiae TaxID=2942213 RepID=A0ABT0PET5_9GAMM|nr:biotin carboxylase N-terminal domain-containing protein [Sansalvadorimonas sp. 2012CJ34-2]MCL6269897.1 ATP-grasp domain-containing protein [Sansalvadorimonas sp. 2012CJ34-2]